MSPPVVRLPHAHTPTRHRKILNGAAKGVSVFRWRKQTVRANLSLRSSSLCPLATVRRAQWEHGRAAQAGIGGLGCLAGVVVSAWSAERKRIAIWNHSSQEEGG